MNAPEIIVCVVVIAILVAFVAVCFKCVMMDPKEHESSHGHNYWATFPVMNYDNRDIGISMEPGALLGPQYFEPFGNMPDENQISGASAVETKEEPHEDIT